MVECSVYLSPQGGDLGGYTFQCRAYGLSADTSEAAVTETLMAAFELVTAGKRHVVRRAPVVTSARNHATGIVEHYGYARGMVWNEPGERMDLMIAPAKLEHIGMGQPPDE